MNIADINNKFYNACSKNKINDIKELVLHVNFNIELNHSAFVLLCKKGYIDIIRFLLNLPIEKRINPSFKSQTLKNISSRKGVPYRGGKSKTCKNKK